MKINVTTQKMPYLQPICTPINVQVESHLLGISAETTDPTEGGDPTGGDNSTPNPFASPSAEMQSYTEE